MPGLSSAAGGRDYLAEEQAEGKPRVLRRTISAWNGAVDKGMRGRIDAASIVPVGSVGSIGFTVEKCKVSFIIGSSKMINGV